MSDKKKQSSTSNDTHSTHHRGSRQRVKNVIFERYYTTPDIHPFDEIEWEERNALISSDIGEAVFEQRDIEHFPAKVVGVGCHHRVAGHRLKNQ